MKKAPYVDQSGTAQAFFQALESRAKQIPNLISPHLGDRVPTNWTVAAVAATSNSTAQDASSKTVKATTAALPLGGRIKVEPWNDQLTLLKPQAEGGAVAEYEKMPFEVAPFLVYLTRRNDSSTIAKDVALKAESAPDSDHH